MEESVQEGGSKRILTIIVGVMMLALLAFILMRRMRGGDESA